MGMSAENRLRNLRLAYENGKIARELYAKNLLRLMELAHHPIAQKLAAAFVLGRIDSYLFERNLDNLRVAPPP